MQSLNRRKFLQGTLLGAAALSLPARSWAQVPGANSDIRVAVIGFNSRGNDHISGMLACRGVRITALCDVDQAVLDKGAAQLKAKGQQVETFLDVRKLLESKNVDAITMATPNHWHALASIWGVQAGKDVYVEKPVSHNVWEGRQIVNAARAHNKIVQTGTQSRSSVGLQQAVQWAKAGNLGKLLWARGTCYKRRASIGKVAGEQAIPAGIDYDLWCGPAEKLPLHRAKLHYDWHWVWNTGNGDIGNQGIHQMDVARWFLGEQTLSPKIFSAGGRLGYADDGETPNTMFVVHEYAAAPLIFEVRGLPAKADAKNQMDRYRGMSVGTVMQYENGYISVPDYTSAAAFGPDDRMIKRWGTFPAPKEGPDPGKPDNSGEGSHFANFINAVRSRKASDLTAEILEGHLSSALCHTGNISYRLGRKASPGAIREKISGNKEATETFGRMAEHLAANQVDITADQLALGEFLQMDPSTERFIGNAEADKLLTRDYRAPFIVPEKV
ncbi:MAG TPA: Gfo/Idh/MocA family oxidoreductase [Chthoniobacteraceae bacterium]|jgi:predicted dehydrogenase